MREEHAAPQQYMRLVTREPLEPLQQRIVNSRGAKLLNELVVVDSELLSIFRHASLDIPGGHDLAVRLSVGSRLDRRRGMVGLLCCLV